MYYSTTYQTPVGLVTLASDGERLLGLWNEGQKYHGASVPGPLAEKHDLPVFLQVKQWLDAYFAGKNPSPETLPLAPVGSEFRQEVWNILCRIPYGKVTTYGDIGKQLAKKMGKERMSAQAVGGAVGHNPISIIIPCHRVVGSDGSLTGYAGGIDIKVMLLELEGTDLAELYIPTKGTAL